MKTFLPLLVATCILPALPAWAGDLSQKAELGGVIGGLHLFNGGDHSVFGGFLGYGFTPEAQIYMEVTDAPIQRNLSLVDFQGGVKYTLFHHEMFEPYAVAAMGVGHFTSSLFGDTGFGLHAGFGTRVYVGRNWGVVPEVKWSRYFFSGPDTNTFRYTAGVFFQWGN